VGGIPTAYPRSRPAMSGFRVLWVGSNPTADFDLNRGANGCRTIFHLTQTVEYGTIKGMGCFKHPDAPRPAGTGSSSRYKCVVCWRESIRISHRRKQRYDEWWVKQNGLCALCGNAMVYEDITSCLDHNHVTGQKRGLVHSRCNQLIAGFENMINEIGLDQGLRYIRGNDILPPTDNSQRKDQSAKPRKTSQR
jgi:Recombination endonuclease VII